MKRLGYKQAAFVRPILAASVDRGELGGSKLEQARYIIARCDRTIERAPETAKLRHNTLAMRRLDRALACCEISYGEWLEGWKRLRSLREALA